MKFDFHECEYCDVRYERETSLTKHLLVCKKKERWDSFDSKRSRSAFRAYQDWMECKGFGKRSKSEFIESKHYTSFIKFADYYTKMMIPDRKGYIRFLSRMKLLPSFWTNDDAYAQYIADFDKMYGPVKQFEMSIEVVSTYSRILDCELHEVWDYLEFGEVLKLIDSRKMTPWLLLHSQSFKRYLSKRTKQERIVFEAVIDSDKWLRRFRDQPDAVKKIIYMVEHLKV